MKRNQKVGLCFLLTPFIGLIVVLSGWAVMSFIMGSMASTTSNGSENINRLVMIAQVTNVGLGFLGLLCVVSIPVGLVGGIYFMAKGDKQADSKLVPPTEPTQLST